MENKKYLRDFSSVLSVEKCLSTNTIDGYSLDIKHFLSFIEDAPLISVSGLILQNYVRYLSEENYSNSTIARKISSLRALYSFLVREGVIKNSPALGISSFKKSRTLPKFLKEDEIRNLLCVAKKLDDNGRAFAILAVMYSSGIRVSELLSIKKAEIKLILKTQSDDFRYMTISGKGQKERIVVFNNLAVEALEDFLKHSEDKSIWLFPSSNPVCALTRQRVIQILKLLAIKAKIDPSRVSPHVIRHSFATHLLNRNADIIFIQKQLGHSSVATTEIYTHVAKDRMFKAIRENHPLNNKDIFGEGNG